MSVQNEVAVATTDRGVRRGSREDRLLVALFATTAFSGAALLFVVQPLVAKLLLPSYGGSATVWSTSSLFFQVLLLAAYWYVHWSTGRLGHRWQPRLHVGLLILPALVLPIALPANAAPDGDGYPALWLLRTLILMIGLPFAVVATTGPVLQKWFSWTTSSRAHDPYFLFAASNLGSFGGLLAYPLVIEPTLSLAHQRLAWSVGFLIFAALTLLCSRAAGASSNMLTRDAATVARRRLSRRQVLYWTGLAFLPSTMMLGVTAHLSTDVAAIPLLWVVPLAIYLATFVLAFRRKTRDHPVGVTRAALAVTFVAVATSLLRDAVVMLVLVNLVMLALVGFAAHARLANDRPATDQLTSYYLVIAFGGALGGLLNGLVAPMVFDRVLEYPLALLAVPLLMIGVGAAPRGWLARQLAANRVRAGVVTLCVAVAAVGFQLALTTRSLGWLGTISLVTLILVFGWVMAWQPVVLLIAMLVVLGISQGQGSRDSIDQSRTFFGSYTVHETSELHVLTHGTTVHGTQFQAAARRSTPTSYYSRSGPLGDLFTTLDTDRFDRVAVVGLGTGTVAAYGRPGQTMTFFEIDAGIVSIARDPELFSYLDESAADVETVVGDGRLRIGEYPAEAFDLIVLDAFSSDSIPIHLLTQEALASYADRLAPDGVLMVHLSNRIFDLEPVLASAAQVLGWRAVLGEEGGADQGATASEWVAISADQAAADRLLAGPIWREVDLTDQVRWTDDYSSILSVLR